MITWVIIWVLMFLTIILLIAQEVINRSIEKRFCIICVLIFAFLFSSIFSIGAYNRSKSFAQEYIKFQNKMERVPAENEYIYIGQVINYNNYLKHYKSNLRKLGVFAPYCKEIRDLEPIQLETYDTSKLYWGGT